MPIPLGILAVAGAGGGGAGSYDLIATATGTGSSGVITFSSLPAGYKHLQIRGVTKTTFAGDAQAAWVRFNSDSGANYSRHQLRGTGSLVQSLANTDQDHMPIYGLGTTTASVPSATIMDILDPFSTTKNKTVRALEGYNSSGNQVRLASGSWRSTSAVTTITITADSGNFTSLTRLSLYGIKG